MKYKLNIDFLYLAKSMICLCLLFGFGYLEPFPGLHPVGMKILGVFLGMLFGWITIGYVWPSLMGLLALGLSGYQSVNDVITFGLGNASVTALVIFLCMLAKYVEDIGLSNYIANWFISRKISIGKPWIFTGMIFACAYVLGATVSLYASILLMWSIFYSICEKVGYKKFDKFPTLVLIGIAYSALMGFAIFPFKALQLMVLGSLNTLSEITISFADFTILSFIMSIVGIGCYIGICKYVLKPDISLLNDCGDIFGHLREQKMNREQKIGMFFVIFFFFAMFAPSIFPAESLVGGFFKKLGTTGSLVFVIAIMSMLNLNGKILFDINQAAKGINWELIILFTATMPVAAAMSSSQTGVMNFIIELIYPFFNGMSPFLFTISFLLFISILTQFINNVVLAAVFPAIVYNFCISFGANVCLIMTLFTFTITLAFATPGGSSTPALVYSNKEWINSEDALKYCCLITGINIVTVFIIGLSFGQVIFA